MSTHRPGPGPGPELPPDAILDWNEHLGRLLEHASSLLRDWETAAQKTRDQLRDSATASIAAANKQAVEELRRALGKELEEFRREVASAQRELRGIGSKPPAASAARRTPSWTVAALVFANVVLSAALVALAFRAPVRVPAPSVPIEAPATAPADKGLVTGSQREGPPTQATSAGSTIGVVAAPAVRADEPPRAPCSQIAKGHSKPTDPKLILACAEEHCPKVKNPASTASWAKRCLPGANPNSFEEKLRKAISTTKLELNCKPAAGGRESGWVVDGPWLDDCLSK